MGREGERRSFGTLFFTRVHTHIAASIDTDRAMYGWMDVCARTNDIPEERCIVHPLWHEMALVHELLSEGVEGMLLARGKVAQPAWQGLVVGVGDALGERADAGGF